MTDVSDSELLEEFARSASEPAFTALVERHLPLVYSVARRQTADGQNAEDITQAVFIILARKASSLGRKIVLSGWLYHTARLTAANWHRAEMRRRYREQEAFMQSKLTGDTPDTTWRELSPQLEAAMATLGASDRDALVLRYFQNRSMAEVGAALGWKENTAQKRVGRALERLRKFFGKKGFALSTAALAATLATNSVHAAPAGLVAKISTAAVLKGSAASTSTLALVKGALKVMAWTKAKTTVVVGVAVILSAGTYTGVEKAVHRRHQQILNQLVANNRFWLLTPPDAVTNYSYVFHLQWDDAPGGFIVTPVHVTNPRTASAIERQAIEYSSLLQRIAKNPNSVQVQKVTEADGKITLALKFLPLPGAKTSLVVNGQTLPLPPLRIVCGNGLRQNWRGQFSNGGTNAVLVLDAAKMVPLSAVLQVSRGTVEESFSDYTEISPGNYVPLSVSIKNDAMPAGWQPMVFDWKFKLHDGLWLFAESQYDGTKVAWTDQVAVNEPMRP